MGLWDAVQSQHEFGEPMMHVDSHMEFSDNLIVAETSRGMRYFHHRIWSVL